MVITREVFVTRRSNDAIRLIQIQAKNNKTKTNGVEIVFKIKL